MSGGFATNTNAHLIRSQLWSNDIKDIFLDELMAQKYVKMITDFPDGDVINIPSIGQADVLDYVEGQPIKYTAMDTGNFQFSISQYKSSATFITNKMLQDSMYASRLVSEFVPTQARAIAKAMEIDILKTPVLGQTASNPNVINTAAHRWVGSGTAETIAIKDFIQANYSLNMANAPATNRIAIVDPTVEVALASIANIIQVQNNPQWEGIVRDGMSTGLRFKMNIYGFDVYVSQNLYKVGVETITAPGASARTTAQGVANMFFSAAPEASPIVGLVRQEPKVESEYNKDYQREEYVTTCRYGYAFYRPENMITILTDTDQVYV